jgi:methyltransferase (TIGR00027 family)
MDELIMERVKQHGIDTVLNLAAGLDTRAWRLPLPASLRWFDVDLQPMTDYKAGLMRDVTPVCRYEAIGADLTDVAVRDALFSQIGAASTKMLVITEGLLIYLTQEEVESLAKAVHGMRSARWWITDIASPLLLQWMHKSWGKSVESGNAPFKFGPADSAAFFGKLGWREVRFLSQVDEARRLKREMRGMWLWRLMSLLMSPKRREAGRRMSAILLLERNGG